MVGTYKEGKFTKDKAHDVSVHCPACLGRGLRRHRSVGVIPRIEIKTCTKCKGRGRIWVERNSILHKLGDKVLYGTDWQTPDVGTNIKREVGINRK